MAEVRVTKKFKEDFDLWAADSVESGYWSQQEMDDFKEVMRKHELADGPDKLRDTLVLYTPQGKEIPAVINDPKDRYQYWADYFAGRANDIRLRMRINEGINERVINQMKKAA